MRKWIVIVLFSLPLSLLAGNVVLGNASQITWQGTAPNFVASFGAAASSGIIVTDNFTRADFANLGPNWAVAYNPGMTLTSDKAQAGPTTEAANVWIGDTITTNQFAEITIASGGGAVAATVRSTGVDSTLSYYGAAWWPGGPQLQLLGYLNHTLFLNIDTNVTVNPGDTIAVSATNSTITVYWNGAPMLTTTDTSLPVGRPGISAYDLSKISQFRAGYALPPPPPTNNVYVYIPFLNASNCVMTTNIAGNSYLLQDGGVGGVTKLANLTTVTNMGLTAGAFGSFFTNFWCNHTNYTGIEANILSVTNCTDQATTFGYNVNDSNIKELTIAGFVKFPDYNSPASTVYTDQEGIYSTDGFCVLQSGANTGGANQINCHTPYANETASFTYVGSPWFFMRICLDATAGKAYIHCYNSTNGAYYGTITNSITTNASGYMISSFIGNNTMGTLAGAVSRYSGFLYRTNSVAGSTNIFD